MAEIGKEIVLGERDGAPIPGVYLGEWQSREWYWNQLDNSVMWRVPETRECIAAPSGYKILAADYSQIEVKLMAFLSNDPGLLKALNAKDASGKPTDIHCYISTEVYGKKLNFTYDEMIVIINGKAEGGKSHPRFKELKRLRANIKTVTFGVPYGAGAKRVAAMTGMKEEEAQQFIDDYFAKFPTLKTWIDAQGDMAIRYGFTQTPWGRKRFYVIPPRTDENFDAELQQIRRWAGNHPIQASNADMLKDALRRIYSRMRGGILNGPKLYDGRLLLVVHDEVVMMAKEEDAEAISKIMYESMSEAYDAIITGIPNKIDVVIDDTWEKV
jgi:DNA polymerase-1